MQLFGKQETEATKENIRYVFHGTGKFSKENRIEEEQPISKTLEKFWTVKKKGKKIKRSEATSLKITEQEKRTNIDDITCQSLQMKELITIRIILTS